MPLVGEGEEGNATGREEGGGECQWYGRGRRRMEYMNGVHKVTLANMAYTICYESRAQLMVFLFLLQVM